MRQFLSIWPEVRSRKSEDKSEEKDVNRVTSLWKADRVPIAIGRE
jgi:hypothetical protein